MHTFGTNDRVTLTARAREEGLFTPLHNQTLEVCDFQGVAPGYQKAVAHPQLVRLRIVGTEQPATDWISGHWIEPA